MTWKSWSLKHLRHRWEGKRKGESKSICLHRERQVDDDWNNNKKLHIAVNVGQRQLQPSALYRLHASSRRFLFFFLFSFSLLYFLLYCWPIFLFISKLTLLTHKGLPFSPVVKSLSGRQSPTQTSSELVTFVLFFLQFFPSPVVSFVLVVCVFITKPRPPRRLTSYRGHIGIKISIQLLAYYERSWYARAEQAQHKIRLFIPI